MAGDTKVVEPNVEVAERYGALLEIYRDVYDACSGINRRLVNFARDHPKTENMTAHRQV